jgi:Flp pilus assembly protein TadG
VNRTTGALHRAVRRRLDAAHGDSGVGVRGAGRRGAGPRGAGGGAGRGDRGMTAIEFVFLTPVLFFMIFATVQFGLYFFADHVAQAAAQAGARKARAEANDNPGWAADASQVANDYVQQLGPQLLTNPEAHPLKTGTSVSVRVTGRVPTIFPGMKFHVDEKSQGPIERFVRDTG